MSTNYKDIVITPYRGDANNNPVIRLSSGDATTNSDMNVRFYSTSNGTLSFEGASGQAFSVTNDLTGVIYSVNDISGIPSIEVDANGKINMAHFGGKVGIGNTAPGSKLVVQDTLTVNNASVFEINPTWNGSGNTFTAMKVNVTDTASGSLSNLIDVQIGGTNLFKIRKDGRTTFVGGAEILQTGGIYSSAELICGSYLTLGGFNQDLRLTRKGPSNLRFGADDAASPVAQTLSVQGVAAGTSNTAGANLTIQGSQSTGTGAGGSIIFQVAPAGAAANGTVQNALATALTINSTKSLTVSGTSVFLNGTSPGSSSSYIAQDSNYLNINAPNGRQMYFSMGENWGIFSIIQSSGQTGSAVLQSDGSLAWYIQGQNAPANNNFGLRLFSDAVVNGGILAQRNGTANQTFRIYGTYTDGSNYERLSLSANSTASYIQTEAAGTGTAKNLILAAGSTPMVTFTPSGFAQFNQTKVYGANWAAGYHTNALTAIILELSSSVDNVLVKLTSDDTSIMAQRNGTANQTSRIYGTYTDASNYERLSLSANSSGHYIVGEEGGTGSARPLYLGSNNTIAATIDTSSNVGIGTSTPTTKFQVIGTSTLGSSSRNVTIRDLTSGQVELSFNGSDGNASRILTNQNDLIIAPNTGIIRIGTSPSVSMYLGLVSSYLSYGAYSPSGWGLKSIGNPLVFESTVTDVNTDVFAFNQTVTGGRNLFNVIANTTSRMIITSAGNVGIGNTSPPSLLSVGSGGSGGITVSASAPYVELIRPNQSNWKLQHLNNGLGIQNAWGVQIYRNALVFDDGLGISTQELLRLGYFGGVGAVGIGISAPTAKLTVANSTSPTTQHNYGTYTDASNYERIAITANSSGHYIIGEEGGTGSARSLYLGSNNTTAVTIDTAGRVGIGTTSPAAQFHLASTSANSYSTQLLQITSNTGTRISTIKGDGRFYVGSDNGYNVVFSVDNKGEKKDSSYTMLVKDTYNLLMSSTSFVSDSPDFSFGANNFGGSLEFISPAGNGMIRNNRANTTIGQGSQAGSPDKTLRVWTTVANNATSLRVRESDWQGTQESFGVYANNDTTPRLVVANGNIGIGTSTPNTKLEIISSNTMSTTASIGGLSIKETGNKTYPTTSSFTVTAGISQNIELGGTQTINSGFNYIYGIQNVLTKSNGNVQDIERAYFNGFVQSFNWTDQNTCKQYVGIQDIFIYSGYNTNGRTTSYLGATTLQLAPPSAQTQTIATASSPSMIIFGGSTTGNTDTVNITTAAGYSPTVNFYNIFAGTHNYNITNYSAFETPSTWGPQGTTGTLNTTITNYYGLKLSSPSSATGLTVTNNFGVYQQWSLSKNYFAGDIGIGLTTPTARLTVANGTSATSQHIYGTYTDASNYERLSLSANSTASYIQTEQAGTGTARPLYLGSNNSVALTLGTTGVATFGNSSSFISIDSANKKISSLYDLTLESNNNGSMRFITNGNQGFTFYNNSVNMTIPSATVGTWYSILGLSSTTSPAGSISFYTRNNGGTNGSVMIASGGSYTKQFFITSGGQAGGQVGTDVFISSGVPGSDTLRSGDVYIYGAASGGTGRTGNILLQHDAVSAASGNVGIGTSTPSEKLTVQGNVLIGSAGTGSHRILFNNGLLTESFRLRQGGYVWTANTVDTMYLNTDGQLQVPTVSATTFVVSKASGFTNEIGFTGRTFSANGFGGATGVLLTSNNASWYLDNRGSSTNNIFAIIGNTFALNIQQTGEVGIGITAPTAKLTVASGTSATTQHNYGTYTDGSNYERLAITANSTAAYIQTEAAGTGTARPLYLGANNSVAITPTGNVGIGISSPGSTLDVFGPINVRTGVGGTLLLTSGANGAQIGYVGGANFYIGNAGILPTSTNAYALGGSTNYWASSYIRGINMNSGDLLAVGADQTILLADPSDGGMYLKSNYSGAGSGGIKFQVGGGGTKVFIDKSGNVGIANTAPGSKFVVQDNVTVSGASTVEINPTWNAGSNTVTALKMNVTDTASGSSSLLMDLKVGGTTKASITKGGQVVATGANYNIPAFLIAGTGFGLATNGSSLYLTDNSSNGQLGVNGNSAYIGGQIDTFLSRKAAANLRLGKDDVAAPIAQTLSVQSVVAGTSNTAGANLTIQGSQSTGTGVGGPIIFQVSPAGTAANGTVQNALVNALTLSGDGTTYTFGPASLGDFKISRTVNAYNTASTITLESGGNITFHATLNGNEGGRVCCNDTYPGFRVASGGAFSFSPNSTVASAPDLILTRKAAATLRLGAGDAAAPIAQTLSVQGVAAGTANTAGANLTIQGSQSTGTGAGGNIIFQVSPAGANGNTQNPLVTALTIAPNSSIYAANTISDRIGDVRKLPTNAQTASYILTANDSGKMINITTGGITVPNTIFSDGDSVTIYNNSSASQSITTAGGVTMYLVGTALTGTRTLGQRGLATVVCVSANNFIATGGGLT